MIENKKNVKDVFGVLISKAFSTVSSILTGFAVPVILGVTGFGYYKIFTLYAVYTAMMHFGFADGILLKFAGVSYDELDKESVRAYTSFFALFQILLGGLLFAVGACIFSDEYRSIAELLAVNLVSVNITAYFQFISQATKRFREYSQRNMIATALKFVVVLCLSLVCFITEQPVDYKIYIILIISTDVILLVWYLFTYKDIIFGTSKKFSDVKREIIEIFKIGILMMLAYQAGHFALVLDRQFVSVLYDTDTYSVYAFAYNIVGLFTALISSISVVMLPVLKRIEKEKIPTQYTDLMSTVVLISCLGLCGYFPICFIVERFLPDYLSSLEYLRIVLPAVAVTSCLNVVTFTFYKITNNNHIYLAEACGAIVLGFCGNAIAYNVWKTPQAISWASVFTSFIWLVVANVFLQRKYGIGWGKELICIILNSAAFYAVTSFGFSPVILFILNIAFCIALAYLFYHKKICSMLSLFKRKRDDA